MFNRFLEVGPVSQPSCSLTVLTQTRRMRNFPCSRNASRLPFAKVDGIDLYYVSGGLGPLASAGPRLRPDLGTNGTS